MAEHASPAPSDTKRPFASVIVLGWNGRHYLDDCLSSVLDQDLPEDQFEVLYVDNGSRDGSAAYVTERFPRARVLALDHNYGYAEGNNIGYRETRGDYVVFLNQDTVVHRSWLRELLAAAESSPDIGAGHANIIQPWYPEYAGIGERAQAPVAYTSEVNRWGYIGYRKLPSTDRLYDSIFLHGVCIILRRSVADQLGDCFDADFFAYAEDLDLGLRVRALGYRCVAVPKAVVYHKHTLQTSLSWYTVVKTVRIIRNRYLAFYKVMSGWEFALMLPLMTIGAPFNALEFGLGGVRRILYGLALVPATAVALVITLTQLPKFAAKRRQIRRQAAQRQAWCLRALWSQAWNDASRA
jgi:GT2 family glycosyltransferase